MTPVMARCAEPVDDPSWAHGYARFFGFFALFILGFACHTLPWFLGTTLRWPVLASSGRRDLPEGLPGLPRRGGNGEGAYLLHPRPRDFTSGQFRSVSTWDNVPSDEDLFLTISRGMPGSAMPSWSPRTFVTARSP